MIFSRLLLLMMMIVMLTMSALAFEPGQYRITVYQNEDYHQPFVMASSSGVMNLTGYSYKAQVRKNYEDTTALADFTVSIDIESGTVTLSLTAAQTNALANALKGSKGFAYWDLMETDPSGNKIYIYRDIFIAAYTATRP